MPRPGKNWLPAAASAGLALLLYAVTLGGTYVYDDRYIVESDPRISHPDQWSLFWTTDYFNGGPDNLYRPLVSMSYAIQWWLHGTAASRAWLFHMVNLFLHAAVCASVAELARRLLGFRVALIAGLLFAAHPVHVEAVANIVGRAELMCALGITIALVLFLHRPLTAPRALAIWGAGVLALLSKEQGMLLPLALLALVPVRRAAVAQLEERPVDEPQHPTQLAYATPQPTERKAALLLILLLCWTLAAYIIFRESRLKFWWDRSFLDWTINPLVRSTGADRYLLPIALFGRYVALLFFPLQLNIDYGPRVILPTLSPHDPYLYLGVAGAALAAILLTVALLRRDWKAAYPLFGFALFYSVISNLLTLIGVHFAERLIYIPSVFFLVLIAQVLASLRRPWLVLIVAVLLVLFSTRTVTYAWKWNDRRQLFEYALANHPQSVRLHLLVAEEMRLAGRYDEAEAVLARGRALQPDYFKLWLDSAQNQYEKGDFPRAREFILRADALRPSVKMTKLYDLLTTDTTPTTGPAR
ncbi:MAG TPA: tetratricopeptide repeat protein [Tepidisphaeraceae bacterium]|jgi:hypothetical protein